MTRFWVYALFFVLNFGALGVGGLLMDEGPTSNWYATLNKAPWTPDGWVFGFAWTLIMILYSVYCAELFLILRLQSKRMYVLLTLQLITNVYWNYAFFNQHNMILGMVVLTVLTLVIWWLFFDFRKIMKLKSYLLGPYMLWLLVACSLNAYAVLNN